MIFLLDDPKNNQPDDFQERRSNQETRPSHKAARLGLFWKKLSRKSISGTLSWKSHPGTKTALSPKKNRTKKQKCGFSSKYGKNRRQPTTSRTAFQVRSSFSEFFFEGWTHIMNSTPCSHFPMWEDWWCPPQLEWSQRRSLQSNLTASTGARFTALWTPNQKQHQTQMLSQGAVAHHLTSSYFSRIHLRRNVERWHFSPTETTKKIPWRKEGTKRSKIRPTPRTYHEKKIGLNMTPPSFC